MTSGKEHAATTRQTAGPGFEFEDLTAAWLLLSILKGEALPGVDADATQIQSQTGALGWEIDDLLLNAGTDSSARHLALSCKSSMQVTSSGFPSDFISRVWKQWRLADGPLRRDTDVLALVTRGRHQTFGPVWADISNWCSGGPTDLAISRIRESQKHTKIFESIRAPAGGAAATNEEAMELVRHLHVMPLDFQLDPDTSTEDAIGKCKTLLRSGDRREAEALWAELVNLARETRLGSGTLSLTTVWSVLRGKFHLLDRPNFEGSWKSLRDLTSDYRNEIQSALPSGFVVDRAQHKRRLAELIQSQAITVVFGASGTGKSALVKATLDEQLSTFSQVWLGPEQADAVTSNVQRVSLSVTQPLIDVLEATGWKQNVLVIDAAERLNVASFPRVKQLIQGLVTSKPGEKPTWHVVVISQTEGWRDRLQIAVGQNVQDPFAMEGIDANEVRMALRSNKSLSWLAARDETVSVLRNLRTLAWVFEASSAFQSEKEDFASPAAIVDRIWEFWTEGKATAQNLLMRLAEREASFIRSFPLSELEPADAAIFQDRPAHLPIRKNNRNQIEFEHDLAADWARFQRLKEIADRIDQWSALANNPLWGGALHMLGQLLLREPAGDATAWDAALNALEGKGATLAADMLLDALCLDPQADTLLQDRVELLFANGGKRLDRLLRRFLHLATVPNVPPALRETDRALALYMDDNYRTPIVGLWPPIVAFLYAQRSRVAELTSPTVAKVCETWLSTLPLQLKTGAPMPLRKELADIALATARALQVELGKGTIYLGEGERPIYSAAFAAAWDIPDEVTEWALEMAQRRPMDAGVASKIAEAKAKAAADRQERLRTDPEFRRSQEELSERRRSSGPSLMSSSRKLPPWPMGPKRSVENDFQQVCLHSQALVPLMNKCPDIASEILLATLIEGNPREDYSPSLLDEKVGLDYDGGDSYPTAFWKSQFFTFLRIAPDVALGTLLRLVDFCVERWAHAWTKDGHTAPHILLTMPNAREKRFIGNARVFDWTQDNSNFIGQLHCALNALERWLTLQIEQGQDVEAYLARILREGSSIALVGLLINVAKFRPALLSGPLMPLVSSCDIFELDHARVQSARFHFDALSWFRAGEAIFNMARDWTMAPYRQKAFLNVVTEIVSRNGELANFLKSMIGKWSKPDDSKAAIEFEILCAQLDGQNYHTRQADTGGETIEFVCPETLRSKVTEYQQASAPKLQNLLLAQQCESVLWNGQAISDADAQVLADVLAAAPSDDAEGRQALNRLAAAATLVANGATWLLAHPEIAKLAHETLRTAIENMGDSPDEIRHRRVGSFDESPKFVAHGVFHLWLKNGDSAEWERALLQLLTSGIGIVASVIGALAYQHKSELGTRWWRLLQLGVLWSALSLLGSEYGEAPDVEARWRRWVSWLRSRRIRVAPDTRAEIDPLGVWSRVKRLEQDRWRRLNTDRKGARKSRPSRGVDTGFLDCFFGWLLRDDAPIDSAHRDDNCMILRALWAYEAAFFFERRDERGDYGLPYQFGYNLVARLAVYAARVPESDAQAICHDVLALGPAGKALVEHFISSWFIQLSRGCDSVAFCQRWREMIAFALDGTWRHDGRRWFDSERLLLHILGFGFESFLTNLPEPSKVVLGMRDLYGRWASDHLGRDEDNIAAFGHFLSSEVGKLLRMDGLKWLNATLNEGDRQQYWRERGQTGQTLVDLLDTILAQDASLFVDDADAREAMIGIAAYLAAHQVPAALSLQERIKHLR